MDELEEQLEAFARRAEARIPTLEEKKKITGAGARVLKKAIQQETPKSGHREAKHVVDSLKMRVDRTTGDATVYFSTRKGEKGHIARFLNDGYMSHGGKGATAHTVRFVHGRHFVEKAVSSAKKTVFEEMEKKYDEWVIARERKSD